MKCGMLEHGLLRAKCDGCRHEHLVAFSWKCRGFLASGTSASLIGPQCQAPLVYGMLLVASWRGSRFSSQSVLVIDQPLQA